MFFFFCLHQYQLPCFNLFSVCFLFFYSMFNFVLFSSFFVFTTGSHFETLLSVSSRFYTQFSFCFPPFKCPQSCFSSLCYSSSSALIFLFFLFYLFEASGGLGKLPGLFFFFSISNVFPSFLFISAVIITGSLLLFLFFLRRYLVFIFFPF